MKLIHGKRKSGTIFNMLFCDEIKFIILNKFNEIYLNKTKIYIKNGLKNTPSSIKIDVFCLI